jgi:hypothetical protein
MWGVGKAGCAPLRFPLSHHSSRVWRPCWIGQLNTHPHLVIKGDEERHRELVLAGGALAGEDLWVRAAGAVHAEACQIWRERNAGAPS